MFRRLNIFIKLVIPVFLCLGITACSHSKNGYGISGTVFTSDDSLLNNSFVPKSDSTNITPLNSKDNVFLVNTIPTKLTSFEYYKKMFKDFNIIGFSIIEYSENFSLSALKDVARSKGSNLVIVKKVYNSSKDENIYDILYLNGKLESSDLYWNRNISEALSLEDSLKNIEADRSQSRQNNHTSMYSEYKKSVVQQDLRSAFLTDLGKIEASVDNIVGEWIDTYDKTRLAIREIPISVLRSYNMTNLDDSLRYYGGYLIINKNSQSTYDWHNNDLKLQFNFSGNNSVYLNKDKMPITAIVRAFPAKGAIVITLGNGEIRYLIPADANLESKAVKNLYKNLPTYIKAQEPSIGSNPSYGHTYYGWLLSTGLVSLLVGIISFL